MLREGVIGVLISLSKCLECQLFIYIFFFFNIWAAIDFHTRPLSNCCSVCFFIIVFILVFWIFYLPEVLSASFYFLDVFSWPLLFLVVFLQLFKFPWHSFDWVFLPTLFNCVCLCVYICVAFIWFAVPLPVCWDISPDFFSKFYKPKRNWTCWLLCPVHYIYK